jgi:glycosyltransferase involved in cell wall biosynthesis
MTNIVVLVRTRDEEERIGKFCEAYKDADTIIVSDGGSLDKTVEIASQHSNVILRPFNERVQLKNGYWRNNDAAHANFLVQQSKEFNPDWCIYDDCDCRPNFALRQNYRSIMEKTNNNIIMAVRIYFWGTEEWFPLMSSPGGQLEPSLYAWKGNLDFRFIDVPPAYDFSINGAKVRNIRTEYGVEDLYPPLALLHYSWDEKRVEYKMKNYVESPLIFAGAKEPILDWMRE